MVKPGAQQLSSWGAYGCTDLPEFFAEGVPAKAETASAADRMIIEMDFMSLVVWVCGFKTGSRERRILGTGERSRHGVKPDLH